MDEKIAVFNDKMIVKNSANKKAISNAHNVSDRLVGRPGSNEMIKSLRTIKDEDEIALIKEANEITNKGILNILKNLKPGLKEYQIESYFDQAIKYYGATGFSFPTPPL